MKLSLREIGRIFSIKIRNFELWRMPKLLNFIVSGGDIFLNCDNAELKRSFKMKFSVSERHRWASRLKPFNFSFFFLGWKFFFVCVLGLKRSFSSE